MNRRTHSRPWAWALYLIAGAVGGAAYMWAPGVRGNGLLFSALGFTAVIAIVVGVRRNKPGDPLAWYLLALAQLLFVSGDFLAYNWQRFFHSETPFPSAADVLYLAVYPAAVIGLLRLIRRRSRGGDRASFLDALIVTIGAGLVSWVFLMAPYASDKASPLLPKLTAIAYPLMDLALLAVLVRLAVGSGVRVLSYRLLLLGGSSLLIADGFFLWINLHGSYNPPNPLDLGWLAFYFLLGAAALHPSMRRLDQSVPEEPNHHLRRRLAILAAAALLGPLVEVIQLLSHEPLEAGVVSACSGAMFVLVLLRLHSAMVDVGQYRRAERLAREAERKYRSLVEDLPAVVYIADASPDGSWRYVSPQASEILGYPPERFTEDPMLWERSIYHADRLRTLSEKAEAIEAAARLRSEYRIHASDGSVVWIREDSGTIPDDADGRPLRQGVMYDISDIKRAEEALRAALEKERDAAAHLRALDEMKNSFLQAVSHDLRTPLTSILGSALTLEREDLQLTPEDARDLAGRIAANARRLNRLLINLLDMDRISRGIIEPNRSFADLRSLASGALEGVSLDGRRLHLEVAAARAEVDAAQVERILENLVTNALRYTPADTVIDVTIGPSEGGLLIQVDDRGPGVPEAMRDEIFEPFQQGKASMPHSPGVGIGLSLVARFAQLHAGRAWVEARDGGGSSFRVWLHAAVEPIAGDPSPQSIRPPASPAPIGQPQPADPAPFVLRTGTSG